MVGINKAWVVKLNTWFSFIYCKQLANWCCWVLASPKGNSSVPIIPYILGGRYQNTRDSSLWNHRSLKGTLKEHGLFLLPQYCSDLQCTTDFGDDFRLSRIIIKILYEPLNVTEMELPSSEKEIFASIKRLVFITERLSQVNQTPKAVNDNHTKDWDRFKWSKNSLSRIRDNFMAEHFYLAPHEKVFYKYEYFHLNNSNPDNASET